MDRHQIRRLGTIANNAYYKQVGNKHYSHNHTNEDSKLKLDQIYNKEAIHSESRNDQLVCSKVKRFNDPNTPSRAHYFPSTVKKKNTANRLSDDKDRSSANECVVSDKRIPSRTPISVK